MSQTSGITDEFEIYHYQGSEDLEKRIETCRYFIEAWTDAYNHLMRELDELAEVVK